MNQNLESEMEKLNASEQPKPQPPIEMPAKQRKKGFIITIIVCVILAIGGIGFGVYGMIQKNEAEHKLSISQNNNEVANPDIENKDTTEVNDNENPSTITTSERTKNPIIMARPPKVHTMSFSGYGGSDGNNTAELRLTIKNGTISQCELYYGPYNNQTANRKDCKIKGLSGLVYKVVEAKFGHIPASKILFILEDGSVEYLLTDTLLNGDFDIKGKVKIDGFVTDAINISTRDEGGGGGANTVFILNNGSFVEYSENMFR